MDLWLQQSCQGKKAPFLSALSMFFLYLFSAYKNRTVKLLLKSNFGELNEYEIEVHIRFGLIGSNLGWNLKIFYIPQIEQKARYFQRFR